MTYSFIGFHSFVGTYFPICALIRGSVLASHHVITNRQITPTTLPLSPTSPLPLMIIVVVMVVGALVATRLEWQMWRLPPLISRGKAHSGSSEL